MSSGKARPFLKWAGGKSQILPELLQRLPESFRDYHEPFIGGGALFFALVASDRFRHAHLSDINGPLIEAYLGVKNEVEGVMEALGRHKNQSEYFYKVRATDVDALTPAERTARLIYLNKTCFNGLYRENRKGLFNVPFGRYKNPKILDEPNLRAVAFALQSVTIDRRHFSSILGGARRGDLVYFDPPYHPVSSTASFTSYDRNDFGPKDQEQLRDTFASLASRGVHVMLSNSDTEFIRELYEEFTVEQVFATRAINSKADRRGKVAELIVRNYEVGCNSNLPSRAD